jgi:tRNA(Ile)-lysidine synthase
VVVACSGGADSVALLRLLHGLLPVFGWSLICFHAAHGIRKGAGPLDARFVAGLAESLGLALAFRSFDTAELRRSGESLEATARRLRYEALLGLRRDLGDSSLVVTGHTLDDQAETVLLNLSRHSGRRRGGIRERRGDGVVRPLLGIRRGELREFLREAGQVWREDQTNVDPRIQRNRFRHEVLPELEGRWPGVTERLARAGEAWTARLDLIDLKVDEALLREGSALSGPWTRGLFRHLGAEVLGRLLLRALGSLGAVPGKHQLETVIWKARSTRGRFREQIGGVFFEANERVVSLANTGRLMR